MSTNAPHGTTSEYSACCAEPIEGIIIVKAFISDHVIFIVIRLGKSLYEFVAMIKPSVISSKIIDILDALVCRK